MARLQWVNFMIHKFNHNKAAKNRTYFVGLLQGLNGLIFIKYLEERLTSGKLYVSYVYLLNNKRKYLWLCDSTRE